MDTGGNGGAQTTLRTSQAVRDSVKSLIGNIEFWRRYGYEITPGSVDEVLRGFLAILHVPLKGPPTEAP